MNRSLRIGIVQCNPTVGDVAGNAGRIADAYASVSEADPDLVVTPELSLVGYPPRDLLHRVAILDTQDAALNELAVQTADGPPLVVGATVRSTDETGPPIHNSAVVLRGGERTGAYHKRLLPTYDVFDEHRYFRPGEEPLVVDVDDTAVGITICEDAWHDTVVTGTRRHDKAPLQDTAASGAEVILTLSASPFSLDKPARRENRFLAHAAETNCPVVFTNQVGGNDELLFDGHSFVAGTEGIHDRLEGFESDTAVVDVPLDAGTDATVHGWERGTAHQARAALTLGLRDYFEKTGFEGAVIGLSGGIDSSVAAALATDALGADDVYGVALPSRVTSRESVADARAVATNLRTEFDVIPIEATVEALSDTLSEHGTSLTDVAAENVQARIRGDVLMGIANQRDALVLTPDNKSEAAIGYCTLYGDTVGALAPLGDCDKQLVYELAAVFNASPPSSSGPSPVIPQSVIDREPSAELRAGQTDSDDVPAYELLDAILEAYIEEGRTADAIREQYPDHPVTDTLTRTTRAEFKRRQTPPPLRITRKALGRGWNYPIAAVYDHVLNTG